jgi:hypothetical protein
MTMNKHTLLLLLLVTLGSALHAQRLNLPQRNKNALSGSAFVALIRDTALSLIAREQMILKEIKEGNVPQFFRQFVAVTDTALIEKKQFTITYFVAPDYLAVGSDVDYFYCPLTASSAQKIAAELNCILPTRKMSGQIYRSTTLKLSPQPIPPSVRMITVPVFEDHNRLVHEQRAKTGATPGVLTAGNKKDVVISNKIIADDGSFRVVIYGWHKPDGEAIQPLYNGHKYDWVDYSHGIRLIQNKVYINGRKGSAKKILQSEKFHGLLSDEGMIPDPVYPVN